MPKLSFQYVRQEVTETLLEFLVRRFKYHTFDEWERLVEAGSVTLNGRQVGPNHILETRQRIVYQPPPGPEPPVDTRYEVLFEDAHLLAVSKSGNIPTSPSGKYWHHCLVHVLMRERALPELHAVHRLDRETSGVNLFAKTKAAARALGQAFYAGDVRKTYGGILHGHFPAKDAYISAPLRDARASSVRIRQEVHAQGRPASTRIVLKALLPGASLIEARPLTGRTHQIRAHAAYIGHPVWGDKLYGRPDAEFIAWVNDEQRAAECRQLLHATTLAFTHPATGEPLIVRSGYKALMDLFLTARDNQRKPSAHTDAGASASLK